MTASASRGGGLTVLRHRLVLNTIVALALSAFGWIYTQAYPFSGSVSSIAAGLEHAGRLQEVTVVAVHQMECTKVLFTAKHRGSPCVGVADLQRGPLLRYRLRQACFSADTLVSIQCQKQRGRDGWLVAGINPDNQIANLRVVTGSVASCQPVADHPHFLFWVPRSDDFFFDVYTQGPETDDAFRPVRPGLQSGFQPDPVRLYLYLPFLWLAGELIVLQIRYRRLPPPPTAPAEPIDLLD